jgi:hypothetical protein
VCGSTSVIVIKPPSVDGFLCLVEDLMPSHCSR